MWNFQRDIFKIMIYQTKLSKFKYTRCESFICKLLRVNILYVKHSNVKIIATTTKIANDLWWFGIFGQTKNTNFFIEYFMLISNLQNLVHCQLFWFYSSCPKMLPFWFVPPRLFDVDGQGFIRVETFRVRNTILKGEITSIYI